jgi:hypothetical protein
MGSALLKCAGEFSVSKSTLSTPFIPFSNLLAYWKLNQTLSDETANANNLQIANGSTFYASGIIGNGFSFDGETGLTPAYGAGALAFGTGDFSVSLWVYPTSAPQNNQVIVAWGVWPDTSGFVVQHTEENFGFFLGGFQENFNYTPPTLFNVWHHIVVVRTSGTANFYVNGASIGTANWNYNFTDGLYYFGRPQDTASFALNGTLDEVGAWNRALIQAEITSLYNAGAGRTYPFN